MGIDYLMHRCRNYFRMQTNWFIFLFTILNSIMFIKFNQFLIVFELREWNHDWEILLTFQSKLKLSYYKTLNGTTLKTLKNSIYKNISSVISSFVVFINPKFKTTENWKGFRISPPNFHRKAINICIMQWGLSMMLSNEATLLCSILKMVRLLKMAPKVRHHWQSIP